MPASTPRTIRISGTSNFITHLPVLDCTSNCARMIPANGALPSPETGASCGAELIVRRGGGSRGPARTWGSAQQLQQTRSEEHTSELQSLRHLVCRLLLETK